MGDMAVILADQMTLRLQWTDATLTSIDGMTNPGLGKAGIALLLPSLDNETWITHMIGGTGSKGPCLMANDTLLVAKATIFSNTLPDGNGTIIFMILIHIIREPVISFGYS